MVRGLSTSEANLGSLLVTLNARLKSSDSSSMSWPSPTAAAKRWNTPSSVTCRLGRYAGSPTRTTPKRCVVRVVLPWESVDSVT